MIVELRAVRLNGSAPAPGIERRRQISQEVRWPQGFAGELRIAPVLNEDGSIFDLTGTTQRLTLRRTRADANPTLCLESTTGVFTITNANANKPLGRYTYDVVVIEAGGSGDRWQVVPTAPWSFTESASRIGDTVTP